MGISGLLRGMNCFFVFRFSFQKSWKVYNNGTESWPAGCYLQCAGGEKMGAGRVIVPCLQPGEGTTINLDMRSPEQPGTYQSKWRLCTPGGSYFGGNFVSFLFSSVVVEVLDIFSF